MMMNLKIKFNFINLNAKKIYKLKLKFHHTRATIFIPSLSKHFTLANISQSSTTIFPFSFVQSREKLLAYAHTRKFFSFDENRYEC
jgi:hypothetical protein